jgi:hypothetical protein
MPYFVSKSHDLGTIVESTATLDEAVYRAGRHSKREWGVCFVVWHRETRDDKRCRAFAYAGVSRWAQPCGARPNMYGTHHGCETCGGLGLIEDVR